MIQVRKLELHKKGIALKRNKKRQNKIFYISHFSFVLKDNYVFKVKIARTWKQPKCPSTDEWIKMMWHIYTMEYYSAIKRNEGLPWWLSG